MNELKSNSNTTNVAAALPVGNPPPFHPAQTRRPCNAQFALPAAPRRRSCSHPGRPAGRRLACGPFVPAPSGLRRSRALACALRAPARPGETGLWLALALASALSLAGGFGAMRGVVENWTGFVRLMEQCLR